MQSDEKLMMLLGPMNIVSTHRSSRLCEGVNSVNEDLEVFWVCVGIDTVSEISYPAISTKCRH